MNLADIEIHDTYVKSNIALSDVLLMVALGVGCLAVLATIVALVVYFSTRK